MLQVASHNDSQKLCFDPTVFLRESFSIDDFLRNHRNKATLEILRNDLGVYLKDLRLSMIELINKDYEDFVNLSKDLVGLNAGIEVLHTPLDQVKSEINLVRSSLKDAITGMKQCISQTNAARRRRQSLFHMSQVITSMKKLKGLLYDDKISRQESCLDFVERVTSEYIMLQFSVSKCDDILSSRQKDEYTAIAKTIMDLLRNSFLTGMCEKDENHLRRCLRMFSSLGKVADVEELVRKEIVAPFLYDAVNETSLKRDANGLKGIYQKILNFLDGQMSVLLGLADEKCFNFLMNSLWSELAKRLELHTSSIFSAGDPDVFHSRYLETRSFLDNLRDRCSPDNASKFNQHPLTVHFLQKWNLQVYFKIRFQEIAGQIEWTAGGDSMSAWEGSEYHLMMPAVTIMCLRRCWDEQIFIPELIIPFWKLSLQVIARFSKWIKEDATKSLVPATDDLSWPTTHLHQLIWLHSDIQRTATEAQSTMLAHVPSGSSHMLAETVSESCQLLNEANSAVSTRIEGILVEKSVSSLANVRDIPRLFRKTNRESPTKPCEYVKLIVDPLLSFHHTYKTDVPDKVLNQWLASVLGKVSRMYYSSVDEVLENAQKTEESLRRLKRANARLSNIAGSKGPTDDDKIRQQLVVDVHSYYESLRPLGADEISEIRELIDLVEKARDKSEKQ